ncbi:MAG TPA: hypothetical protein VKU02_03285, partial [Gemmataceae bacterium]|nr:hypothetical protein [Gemmataceae bacterium]
MPTPWPPLRAPTQDYQLPVYLTNPPSVIPIDLGRQLFVDDFLIDSTTLRRTAHQPVFHSSNPIVVPGSSPDNRNFAIPYSDGVWYDPAVNLYKMFY